jgi:DNA repair exonuclease SbcCD ATPase subunit
MKFRELTIQNFGTVGNITLRLEDRGLVVVTGRNEDTTKADSNGAGKSLLLDSFCWCLWGKTIREYKTEDSVINRRIGKNCVVSVAFEENGKEFCVVRHRKDETSKKPNDLELFLAGKDISSSSMKTTQEVIDSLLGFTFDTFCVLMPGAGKSPAQMTDTDIKELLESMLRTTDLAKAKEVTDAKLRTCKASLTTLESQRDFYDLKLADIEKSRQRAAVQEASFEKTRQDKLACIDQEVAGLTSELEVLQLSVDARDRAETEVEEFQKQVEAHKAKVELCRLGLQTLHQEYTPQLAFLSNKLSELRGRMKVEEQELAKIKALEDTCAQCLQDVPKDHKHSMHLERQSALDATKAVARSTLTDLSTLQEDKATKLAVLEKAQMVETLMVSSLSQILEQHQEVVSSCTAAAVRHQAVRQAIKVAQDSREDVEGSQSPYSVLIQEYTEASKTTQASLDLVLKSITALEREQKQLKFWQLAFSTSGIRSYLLDHVTPVLNERVKHYCDVLTGGETSVTFSTKSVLKSGETREKFSIGIEQEHGGDSYNSSSKGEKQRANLAVSFALSDLAEMYSNKKIDFRFLDEPFENVDEVGIDAIVALLQEQKQRYPTVFVVTHLASLKNYFPTEIVVRKKKGISTLE